MLYNLGDGETVVDVSVKHPPDQVNAILRKRQEWDSKRVVQNLIDVIEWVFFVNDCVKQNTKSPDILLFASVGFALQDLRRRIIC